MTIDVDPRQFNDHPPLEDLVAFADGELDAEAANEVGSHVEGCGACAAIIAGLADAIDLGARSDDPVDLYEFEPLTPFPALEEPRKGEIWQLEWERDALVAIVLDAEGQLLVAAVTREPPQSVEEAVSIDLDEPRTTLWVWRRLTAEVPLGVFSHPVNPQPRDGEPAVLSVLAQERSWLQYPMTTPSTTASADALLRADLVSALASLANAAWAPVAEGDTLVLRDALISRGLRPSTLATITGLQASAITDLLRGSRPATGDEAEALALALDLAPTQFHTTPAMPSGLIRAVERPAHRSAIRLRAVRDSLSEAAARVSVAEAVMAMAARTVGDERDVEVWDELLRHHLSA